MKGIFIFTHGNYNAYMNLNKHISHLIVVEHMARSKEILHGVGIPLG